jgi:O-antigen ligase
VLVAALLVGCWLVALFVALTAGNCSASSAIPVLCQPSFGAAAAIAIAALPLVAFVSRGHLFAAVFGLYIILVPIDDALHVGPGLSIDKLVGIACALIALGVIVRRRPRVRLPEAIFGWAAVVALMAVSTIWGMDPAASSAMLVTILSTFALFVIVVATPIDPLDFRVIVIATITSGAIMGLIAIVMARSELSTAAGQVGRLLLNFGTATEDPNRFGASLLLPVAMTVGAVGKARGWQRIGLLAILPLPFAAYYFTASRGTTLALIAMAIVGILSSKHRVALIAIFGVCVSLILFVPNEITSRFLSDGTMSSGAGRLDIWTVAVPIFRSHWLFGTGAGTFISAYNHAFFSGYQSESAGWNRDPHSLLVSTATELGVTGIIAMVGALVLQYRSLRLIGSDHPYPWMRTVFTAAFVGLVVASLFVDVLATKFAWLLFTEMLVAARLAARPATLIPQPS